MRTVHETEALRPSDPIPKSMQPFNKMRLQPPPKLGEPIDGVSHPLNGVLNGSDAPVWTSSYPAELGFTAEEEARGPKELYRLLRRQAHWAAEEGELLKKQCESLEALRRKEWHDKEVLFDQVIRNEVSWSERRQEVLRTLNEEKKQTESELDYFRRLNQGFARTYSPARSLERIQGNRDAERLDTEERSPKERGPVMATRDHL